MTTIDQILLKLGIDQSQVGPGLQSFRAKVNQAMKGAHGSLIHVESAGKSFKKLLHELTAASPGLGYALRLAVSPITGIMLGAVAVFAYFNEKIKEADRELNKMASENARPLFHLRDVIRETASEIERLRGEFRKWGAERDERVSRITQHLEDQTAELESQQRIEAKRLEQSKELASQKVRRQMGLGQIGQGEGLARLNAIETEYAQKGRQLEIRFAQQALKANQETLGKLADQLKVSGDEVAQWERSVANRVGIGRVKRAQDLIEAIKERQRAAAESTAAYEEAHQTAMDNMGTKGFRRWLGGPAMLGQFVGGQFRSNSEIEAEYNRRRKLEADLAKQLEHAKDQLERYSAVTEKGKEKLREAQKTYEDAKTKFDSTSDAVEKARLKLKELGEMPLGVTREALQAASRQYLPSIDQVAMSGSWQRRRPFLPAHWVPGPFAGIAQQIQGLQADAVYSAAMGNMGRHNQDVLRLNALKDILRSAGIVDPAEVAQKTSQSLEVLAGTVKNGAMNVNVTNGE